jgi:hypothetical protein
MPFGYTMYCLGPRWFMVFSATFNNISVISWWPVLLTRVPAENQVKSLANFITYCCIEHTSPWTGFELTTLVMIGTACTDSCKSNYHMIMIMTTTASTCFNNFNVALNIITRQKHIFLYSVFVLQFNNLLICVVQ